MLDLERRAIAAFEALGVLMTDTCINYQTIMPPVRGEHVRLWRHRRGDLFEQRVRRALELRGRAVGAERRAHRPHAALRLSSRRAPAGDAARATSDFTPRELNDWGALGGIVGRLAGDYWQVPALVGIDRVPDSDEMKHFGAALASYGSVALFHMAGVTPEAQRLDDVVAAGRALRTHDVGGADIRAFQAAYAKSIDTVDLVVFSAPQLSLVEMAQVADTARRPARHASRCSSSPARRSSPTPTAWG